MDGDGVIMADELENKFLITSDGGQGLRALSSVILLQRESRAI